MEINNDEIKVSINCLVYNHEKYLRDCLDGFVNQKTNFKFEVLVHDDASTDGSTDIIREYERKYPDIIKPIYQTENQYSKGVKITDKFQSPRMRGEYLATCEGDDYWCDENKLQMQVDFLDSHPDYIGCVHNTRRLDCRTGLEYPYSRYNRDQDVPIEDIISFWGTVFHTSSKMFRIKSTIPNHTLCVSFGDYPTAIYYALEGKIYYFNKEMSVYRFFSTGSWSERKEAGGVMANIKHHQEVIDLLNYIDKYTNYKYHSTIKVVISDNKVAILDNNYEYRKIFLDKNLRKAYCKRFSKKKQLIMLIGALFPNLVKKHFEK